MGIEGVNDRQGVARRRSAVVVHVGGTIRVKIVGLEQVAREQATIFQTLGPKSAANLILNCRAARFAQSSTSTIQAASEFHSSSVVKKSLFPNAERIKTALIYQSQPSACLHTRPTDPANWHPSRSSAWTCDCGVNQAAAADVKKFR